MPLKVVVVCEGSATVARSRMKRIIANAVFLMAIAGASVFGMVHSIGLPGALPGSTRAPLAESTVRAYYLGLRLYLDSGDMTTLRDVVDPDLLDSTHAPAGDLSLYLRALRNTYPDLTFSIENLTASGDTVVARIAIDHGTMSGLPISPWASMSSWQQVDTFRVEHGSIVDWQSADLSSGLFAPIPGDAQPLAIRQASTMTLSRISFEEEDAQYVAIRAPALLFPERDSVQFRGNGLAVVSTIEHPLGQVSEPNRDITVHPGESILLPSGSISLRTVSDRPATLLAVLFVPETYMAPGRETHAAFPVAEQLLSYAASGQIGPGITIELLDGAVDSVLGSMQIEAGIAVFAPGTAMTVDGTLVSAVTAPRTGHLSKEWNVTAGTEVFGCGGNEDASIWVVGLRPARTA